jgi:hypothetical protein
MSTRLPRSDYGWACWWAGAHRSHVDYGIASLGPWELDCHFGRHGAFRFALALKARTLKGMDVLAATAAYAAVLVVFVGSSLPPVA